MDRLGAREVKSLPFEVKAAEMGDGQYAGTFTGYAAGLFNIDSQGDMILPGAFSADIPRFLQEGVVCWQHDWMTPIGVPTAAREDGYGLLASARISRTPKGEEAMTLIRDGVVKKLSIGFQVQDYVGTSRDRMIEVMSEYGAPPETVAKAIATFNDQKLDTVWMLKKLKLYEFSPVTIPANSNASILDAKSLTGLTFTDHSRAVLTAVEGLRTRIEEIDSLRKSQGRKASSTHGETCAAMADNLEKACGDLRKMAEEMGYGPGKPKPKNDEAAALLAEFLKINARRLGAA